MKTLCGVAAALTFLVGSQSVSHAGFTIIDSSTQGFYNSAIGQSLNGTNAAVDDNGINTYLFPNNNSSPNDPTFNNPLEPDLSAASSALGNWLSDPANLDANWSAGPVAIPSTWTVNSETAIVYEIDAGATGLTNIMADFGVDNGIFVWLNGVYQGGQLRPGVSSLGELMLDLGSLAAGTHYLQVLREDHGGGTGYSVEVTADVATTVVPGPPSLALLGIGALSLLGLGRRRRTENAAA